MIRGVLDVSNPVRRHGKQRMKISLGSCCRLCCGRKSRGVLDIGDAVQVVRVLLEEVGEQNVLLPLHLFVVDGFEQRRANGWDCEVLLDTPLLRSEPL